jgi:flagellin
MLQIAEGALNETHSVLARMRELAVQSANDTLTSSDRLHIQAEVDQLVAEIDRISNSTQFNKASLLNGTTMTATFTGMSLKLHIGPNNEPTTPDGSNEITISIMNAGASRLGVNVLTNLGAATSVTSQGGANTAISTLDDAIDSVSTARGRIGAMQNRLQSAINSLGIAAENTGAANSRIRDADVAQAVSDMVKHQILQQSTMAVLAQANQAPQMALQLLK